MATPAFAFILSSLKRNPNVAYRDLAERAEKQGHKLSPVSYGRAKLLLGMVKPKTKVATKTAHGVSIKSPNDFASQTNVTTLTDNRRKSQNGDATTHLKAIAAELTALRRFRDRMKTLLESCDN